MLLSEEIIYEVETSEPETKEDYINLVRKVLELCHNKLADLFKPEMTGKELLTSINQVCNSWDCACNQLKKDGFDILKKGAFKTQLLEMPEFKELVEFINQ